MIKRTWPEEIYCKISVQNLILIALYNLGQSQKQVSFERILKECFDSFSQKFSISGYKNWPDARKLARPLRTLRKQKLVSGNPSQGFSLTQRGQAVALKILNLLRQKKLKLK
jgi:hypothetical protein